MTKLMAVDPGLTNTGVSLFDDGRLVGYFCFKTKKPKNIDSDVYDVRYVELVKIFTATIKKFLPDTLAIETQYMSRIMSNSTLKVVAVKSLIETLYISYCLENNITPNIISVSPISAKKAIGVSSKYKRKESKEKVKSAVINRYSFLSEEKQDIFDSIAIGMYAHLKLKSNLSTK